MQVIICESIEREGRLQVAIWRQKGKGAPTTAPPEEEVEVEHGELDMDDAEGLTREDLIARLAASRRTREALWQRERTQQLQLYALVHCLSPSQRRGGLSAITAGLCQPP